MLKSNKVPKAAPCGSFDCANSATMAAKRRTSAGLRDLLLLWIRVAETTNGHIFVIHREDKKSSC